MLTNRDDHRQVMGSCHRSVPRKSTRQNVVVNILNEALRCLQRIREFKKTTTATATGASLNKRCHEQNNGSARTL